MNKVYVVFGHYFDKRWVVRAYADQAIANGQAETLNSIARRPKHKHTLEEERACREAMFDAGHPCPRDGHDSAARAYMTAYPSFRVEEVEYNDN